MEIAKIKGIIESILFASGEAVSYDRLTEALEITKDEVIFAIDSLIEQYSSESHGITIYKLDQKVQLATKPDYGSYIKVILDKRRNTSLSEPALEVLSIIAYNQPITRAFIEQVRGVDCSAVVTTLIEKELVEEKGRLDAPGKPFLYGTTSHFLRCFNITSLAELPDLPELIKPDLQEPEQLKLEE